MSAHCITEFVKGVGEKIRYETLPSILSVFPNRFNKSNNTGARMQDDLKILLSIFAPKRQ